MPVQARIADPQWNHPEALEKARDIGWKAMARADETEALRRLPDATMAELRASGLLRVRQPRAYGGHDRPAHEAFEIIHEIARFCPSTGWVYCVLSGHSAQVGQFPMEAQAEVWGADPHAVASSAYAPNGTALPTEGGYRLSGRFPFSSGCDHAQWAMVGGFVDAPGPKRMLIFLVPMESLTIIDDWRTLGLAGTGSKSLAADDIFVPSYRARPPGLFTGGVPPFSLATVGVGLARGAVDQFIAAAQVAPPGRNGRPADAEMIQMAVGQASAEADAAWMLVQRAVKATEDYDYDGFDIPLPLKAQNRGDNALVTQLCVQAVDRLMAVSGAHAIYDGAAIQRRFRDIHAIAQHAALTAGLAAKEAGGMMLNPERPWPPGR